MHLFISISQGVAPTLDTAEVGGIDMNWLHFCRWSKFSRDWNLNFSYTVPGLGGRIYFFRVVPFFILLSFPIDDTSSTFFA